MIKSCWKMRIVYIIFTLLGIAVLHACTPTPTIEASLAPTQFIKQTLTIENLDASTPTDIVMPKRIQKTIATIIPTPTASPVFSISSSNQVLPSDILKEILYFATGGGGHCVEDAPKVMIHPRKEAYLNEPTAISICGWSPKEIIQVSMLLPNGVEETGSYSANEFGGFHINFIPSIYDPPGDYILTVRGSHTSFQYTVNYLHPVGPHIYITNLRGFLVYPNVYPENKKILLFQFSPNEAVRVFAYKNGEGLHNGEYQFIAWQTFQIGSNGNLMIESNLDADFYAAIGEITGEVHWLYEEDGLLRDKFDKISSSSAKYNLSQCPDAPPQRVSKGSKVTVCTKKDRIFLREEPNKKGEIISRLDPGTNLSVIDGPYCSDGWSWWQVLVLSDNRKSGWVSEGGDNVDPYFICPSK